MKLLSLDLRNYRQHRATSLTFDEGITGILGTNGAGKSSILEAIGYALYGALAARRDGGAEGILWQRAPGKADVEVRLGFELSGETYTVERGLKAAKLYKGDLAHHPGDGRGPVLRTGPREVTQYIEERLGMDREAFFNSFFARQKELAFLATVKGAKRQELITKMLGLSQLDEARNLVAGDRRALAAHVKGRSQGLGDLEAARSRSAEATAKAQAADARAIEARSKHTATRTALDAMRPRFEASSAAATEHTRLAAEREKAALALAHAQQAVARLARELAQLRRDEQELVSFGPELADHDRLAAELRTQEALRGHAERRTGLLARQEAMRRELTERGDERSRLEAELAGLGEDPAARRQTIQQALAALDAEISAAEKDGAAKLQEVRTTLETQRKRFKELQARKAHLASGEHLDCPTCLRPLGDALPAVLSTFDAQLQEIIAEGKELNTLEARLACDPEILVALRARRDGMRRELEALSASQQQHHGLSDRLKGLQRLLSARQGELDKLEVDLADLPTGYDAARSEALKTKLEQLAPLKRREAELTGALRRLPVLKGEQDAAMLAQGDAERNLFGLEQQMATLAFRPEDHAALTAEFRELEASERSAHTASVRADEEAAGARELARVHAEQERELLQKRQELERDQRQLEHLEALEEQLRAFRDELNGRIRPELSELTGGYLAQLTDGRYVSVEIDEAYEVKVQDGEELFPVERFSGGEQDLVNLCLRLAISQMIADRAGQDLSLIVLDEVFGSLDEGRRDNVIGLLGNLAGRFSQVILISHLEEIRSALHHVVRVRYDEAQGASAVSVEGDDVPLLAPELPLLVDA